MSVITHPITDLDSFWKIFNSFSPSKNPTHSFFYRGHTKTNLIPLPSIYRPDIQSNKEDKLTRELEVACPEEFLGINSSFEKLVKMQHYGLPTRLLDITENPLIALYFACHDYEKDSEDSEVIIFQETTNNIKFFDSDSVSVLANITWMPEGFSLSQEHPTISFWPQSNLENQPIPDSTLFKSKDYLNSGKLLHQIKNEKPQFEDKIYFYTLRNSFFVKPKLDNARIKAQQGLFIIYGIEDDKTVPATLNEKEKIFNRIRISGEWKGHIISQLSLIGINEKTLFPEIDTLSKSIKEKYTIEKSL